MVAITPAHEPAWAGPTRIFALTIGWGYVAFVLALAAVSTVAAFLV